ncbi:aspartyl/glutamyl-tRNA amidotransferase subunit C [Candidatus Gracilibacteria bacterium]|nr:aspartyl/glutamyl-tRNA amidotransferase subunit C [Candidatus Gracilibacteria bacterium]
MSISQDDLQKIGKKLSKIPADNEKLLKNISDIVDYMELLSEVDTTGVIPTISVIENKALLREDVLISSDATPDELLNCTKQKVVAHQIVLPNIMN